jgi:tetratricopeptide (TPR) repeat protein
MMPKAAVEPRKKTFLETGVIFSVVLLLALATHGRNEVWKSQIGLELDSVKKSPNKARSYTNLTYAYVNAGIYDKALEAGQKAIQLDPKAAYAYFNMGVAYQNLGDLNKAIAMTRKALDLDSELNLARLALAGMYFKNNQFEEAAEEYRKILNLYPYFPNIHHLLGIIYAAQRKFGQAVVEFENEVRVNPSHTLAYVNLGQLYWYEFRDREKALYHLRKALTLDPFLPQRNQILRLVQSIAETG